MTRSGPIRAAASAIRSSGRPAPRRRLGPANPRACGRIPRPGRSQVPHQGAADPATADHGHPAGQRMHPIDRAVRRLHRPARLTAARPASHASIPAVAASGIESGRGDQHIGAGQRRSTHQCRSAPVSAGSAGPDPRLRFGRRIAARCWRGRYQAGGGCCPYRPGPCCPGRHRVVGSHPAEVLAAPARRAGRTVPAGDTDRPAVGCSSPARGPAVARRGPAVARRPARRRAFDRRPVLSDGRPSEGTRDRLRDLIFASASAARTASPLLGADTPPNQSSTSSSMSPSGCVGDSASSSVGS